MRPLPERARRRHRLERVWAREIWSTVFDAHNEATSSPVLVDITGGRDGGDDVLVGAAWGLYLLSGKNGGFLYNTGAWASTLDMGCDAPSSAAVAYVPGAPGNGLDALFRLRRANLAGDARRLSVPGRAPCVRTPRLARMEGERRPHRHGGPDDSCPEPGAGPTSPKPAGYRSRQVTARSSPAANSPTAAA